MAVLVLTRHEFLTALRFPVLIAPFLLATVRYRFFGAQVISARLRDGVDYAPDAWRLSGYVTVLFVLIAYPAALYDHGDWLWSMHPRLSGAGITFWLSLCSWVGIGYFQHRAQEDEKLKKDLESISREVPSSPPAASLGWLRVWGWANAIGFGFLLVGIADLLKSLR
jgi:hypothetical protein